MKSFSILLTNKNLSGSPYSKKTLDCFQKLTTLSVNLTLYSNFCDYLLPDEQICCKDNYGRL